MKKFVPFSKNIDLHNIEMYTSTQTVEVYIFYSQKYIREVTNE